MGFIRNLKGSIEVRFLGHFIGSSQKTSKARKRTTMETVAAIESLEAARGTLFRRRAGSKTQPSIVLHSGWIRHKWERRKSLR